MHIGCAPTRLSGRGLIPRDEATARAVPLAQAQGSCYTQRLNRYEVPRVTQAKLIYP